jgi:enterochelin esterase family protein
MNIIKVGKNLIRRRFFIGALVIGAVVVPVAMYWSAVYVSVQQFLLGWDNWWYTPTSTIEYRTIPSAALQEDRRIAVYLPQGYSTQTSARYPTLYLLHGDPGNEKDWLISGNIQKTADTLIAEKKIPPLIIIMPDGTGTQIGNSQYVNADTVHQNMMDFIALDLVSFVDAQYRTQPDRSARIIAGNSTGGYGALNIAFHYPQLFATIISLSGYNSPIADTADKLLTPTAIASNTITEQLTTLPTKEFWVYIYYGKNDYFDFSKENDVVYQRLTEHGIPATLATDAGIHDWGIWAKNSKPALIFAGQHVPQPL